MAKATAPEEVDSNAADATTEKIERKPYIEICDKAILNEQGQLTAVPTDYVERKHLAPKRGDFAGEDLFLEWRAITFEARAMHLTEQAAKMRSQAEDIRQYGDPAQRAKVRRFQRLQDQILELKAELGDQGIEVSLEQLLGNAK